MLENRLICRWLKTEIAALCAEAVVKLVNIEKVYIKPEVRQFIEKGIK